MAMKMVTMKTRNIEGLQQCDWIDVIVKAAIVRVESIMCA